MKVIINDDKLCLRYERACQINMANAGEARAIMRKHFADLTVDEFMANLQRHCPDFLDLIKLESKRKEESN